MSAAAKRLVDILVDRANSERDVGQPNADSEAILTIVTGWPKAEAADFWTRLKRARDSFRHSGFYSSFLFEATHDPAHLRKLIDVLPTLTADTQKFHELLWYFLSAQFRNAAHAGEALSDLHETLVRPAYHAAVRTFLGRLRPRNVTLTPGRVERVAILSPQILGITHAPTRDALYLAAELPERHGVSAVVLNTNAMPHAYDTPLFRPFRANKGAAFVGLQKMQATYGGYGAQFEILSLADSKDLLASAETLIDYCQARQIDAVIAHDTPFLQDALAQHWPVLFVTTSGVVPMGAAHALWVSKEMLTDAHREIAAACGDPVILPRQLLFSPPDTSAVITRAALGLPEHAVVIVVIGNRLAEEVTPAFRTFCEGVLRNHPQAAIALVSGNSGPIAARFADDVRARVFALGFQNDLRAFYRVCDLYLNPPRIGGGTSAQQAMVEGLPIAALAFGDVGAVAGEAMTVADEEALAARLSSLIDDPAARMRWSEASKARIAAEFDLTRQAAEILETLRAVSRTRFGA
ncbi:MAG: glycosyltransferase family 4 protein [Alphaproteobacteria bacterium]